MKQSRAMQNTIADINRAFRDIQNDISGLQSEVKVEAIVLDRLSQQISTLEGRVTELQKRPSGLSVAGILGLLTILVAIIGILFAAYEWRIDARLATQRQEIQKIVEETINRHNAKDVRYGE